MATAPKPRVSRDVLRILRYIKKKANFENASFADLTVKGLCDVRFPSRIKSDDLTDGIKEATRIYRETWVNGPLDELILWAEGGDADLSHWGRL